jgi:hypothetical protein
MLLVPALCGVAKVLGETFGGAWLCLTGCAEPGTGLEKAAGGSGGVAEIVCAAATTTPAAGGCCGADSALILPNKCSHAD